MSSPILLLSVFMESLFQVNTAYLFLNPVSKCSSTLLNGITGTFLKETFYKCYKVTKGNITVTNDFIFIYQIPV